MDIVKLSVFANAYYSGAEYREDVIISKNIYERIRAELWKYDYENNENAIGVYVGELDGKHSEVEGDLYIEEYLEDEIAKGNWELDKDGYKLYYIIKGICDEKNLDLDRDIENVWKYLKTIDSYVVISIETKKSNIDKIKKYADGLNKEKS